MEKRYKLRLRVHKVGEPMYIGSSGRWHLLYGYSMDMQLHSFVESAMCLEPWQKHTSVYSPRQSAMQLSVGSLNLQAWTKLLKVIPVEQRWLPKIAVEHRCRLHFLRYFVERTKVGAIARIY